MNINAAKTFALLANYPLPLDTKREPVLFYKEQDEEQCYLRPMKEKNLSWCQRIKRFFWYADFSFKNADTLLEIALTHLETLPPTTDRALVDNVRGWCRYIKVRAISEKEGRKIEPLDIDSEKKIAQLFEKIFPKPAPSIIPPKPEEPEHKPTEPILEEGVVKREALSLLSANPAKVRGIVNQGNWCYLNAFVQAALASSRFRETMELCLKDFTQKIETLEHEILELQKESQATLDALGLTAVQIKKLESQIEFYENKKTQNLSSAEHAEVEKGLSEIELPQGVCVDAIKKAGALLQKLHHTEEKKRGLPGIKVRVELLLALFDALRKPDLDGKLTPLWRKSALNDFVRSFEQTGSFFYEILASHCQYDPSELINALCLNDLLDAKTPTIQEINIRQKKEIPSEETLRREAEAQQPLDIQEIFIKAVDSPKKFTDFLVYIAPPEPLPHTLSLQQMFTGILDTYSVEKDKKTIVHQVENKALFDGDAGVSRKELFSTTLYTDMLIHRSLSLQGEAPGVLTLRINRFDNTLNKKRFSLTIPFRLEVPFTDKRPSAIYLLRSAMIHKGLFLRSGHFFTYETDLESVDATTGRPTRFVCKNDDDVTLVPEEKAMHHIQSDAYILFYDKITP